MVDIINRRRRFVWNKMKLLKKIKGGMGGKEKKEEEEEGKKKMRCYAQMEPSILTTR